MITKCFALLDIKVGVFTTPFFMIHEGSAIRACIDLGQDMSTVVGRHPADYILCELGTFDDQAGQLTPITPKQIGVVANFLPVHAPGSSVGMMRNLPDNPALPFPPLPPRANGHAADQEG